MREVRETGIFQVLLRQPGIRYYKDYNRLAVWGAEGHTVNIFDTITGQEVECRSIGDFSNNDATWEEWQEWAEEYRQELEDRCRV